MFEDDDSVFAAMRAGARLSAERGRSGRNFARIYWVRNGEALFGPGIARRLINFFAQHNPQA